MSIEKDILYKMNPDKSVSPITDDMEHLETIMNFETRRVALSECRKSTECEYKIRVSTVFLVLDHNYSGEGEPILFETMVFGHPKEEDNPMFRYTTYKEALEGHHKVVADLAKELNINAGCFDTKVA